MSHNLPNGIPPQMSRMEDKTLPQTNYALNGLGSSHSSREHSPSTVRLNQIPTSQLPPSRTNIPASQLPRAASQSSTLSQLTKNYSHLNISNGNPKEATPFSSPALQKFSTSTPEPVKNSLQVKEAVQTSKFTSTHFDINSVSTTNFVPQNNQATNLNQFTHSSASQFANVQLPTYGINQKTTNSLQGLNKQNLDSNKLYDSSCGGTVQHQATNLVQGQQSELPITSTSQLNQHYQQSFSTLSGQMQPSTTAELTTKPEVNFQKLPVLNYGNPLINKGVSSQPLITPTSGSQNITGQQNTVSQVRPPLQQQYMQPQISTYNYPYQKMQQQPGLLTQVPRNSPSFISTPNVTNSNVDYSKTQPMQELVQQPISKPPVLLNQKQPSFPSSSQTTSSFPINQSQVGYVTPNNQSTFLPPSNVSGFIPPNNQASNNQFGSKPPKMKQIPTMSNESFQYGTNAVIPPTSASSIQSNKSVLHGNRYPVQYNQQQFPTVPTNYNYQQTVQQNQMPDVYQQQFQKQEYDKNYQNTTQNYNPSVTQMGFNKLWGSENYDLLQCPNILPPTKIEPPKIVLGHEIYDSLNCSPEIFRCTITKVPESSSMLAKSRLPLGVLIHPFKDLYHLPVIQCNTIVRCRACRTYINPFVFFVDTKRWKCNICYRVNELPEEFQYDPVSKTYGDPSRRPEVKSSTIEYIAPAEYMLRPPQPAVYLYLLDVSRAAIESGYLHSFCNVLSGELSNLPGDARTQIGFLAYDSALHFYSLADGLSQPHEMTVLDIDDIFLPCPDNLLVNLNDRMELITDLLAQLPTRYNNSYDNNSALGAALQVAHKLMAATGGRVTVFQASLCSIGPGALTPREDPSQRAASEVQHLNPANDFYKRLALECSGQQIAVDLFIINSQYVDLATISGISRFSGGCIYHFPLFKAERVLQNTNFERTFKRYLTRKIGFEAVMRIRCTRGLSIHTFHGNFFVRSTDLLSLPNVNPDSGFGMQVSIEENLSDLQNVCFQAALLYTSSKGERRIRVHTLCLPVSSLLTDIINSADQQCIVGLLAKMAVDRSMQSSLSDAREAFINVAIDILSSYKMLQNMGSGPSGLLAPQCLRLLPLYISAIMKYVAFRTGTSTRLDDRIKSMCDMKIKPLPYLIQMIYPDLYPIHNLEDHATTVINEDEEPVPMPPHLQLTSRNLDSNGAYLMDTGEHMMIIVGSGINPNFLNQVLGVPDYNSISENMYEIPVLENPFNQRLHSFINYLNDDKPFLASLQILRDNSPNRGIFLERLTEDRFETALSYHEFLQHLKTQVK